MRPLENSIATTMLSSVRICLALVIAAVSAAASPFSCPPGFVPQGNQSCVCADWPNRMVVCDEHLLNASMQIGNCMTYDNETGEVRAGGCLNTIYRNDSHKRYYPLPTTVSDLNDQVCGPSNSKGLLCGECQDGFAVAAFWNLFCINCTGASNGWIKYIAAQYIPLTVIFLLVIIFTINIVSGPINSFIFFAQVNSLSAYITYNIYEHYNVKDSSYTFPTYIRSLKRSPGTVAITFYDAWNLKVFPRAYFPFFCLSNTLTGFQGIALEYIEAFYPLVLFVLLYVFIKLHNWNFRPVVCCWRPFLKPFIRVRKVVDPNTSVIDVFATFILLSYANMTVVALLFLEPKPLYNGEGQKLSTSVLAYSPSTLFFHDEHLPLASLSIFVLLTFVAIPPIVLLFYQASFFQKLLTQCKMNSQALRTFVEIFHGCYKDGTNGTRDCRYFAGLYFIFRVIALALSTTASINESVLFYVFIALLFALVRPYKKHIYNVIDVVMFSLIATIFFLIMWDLENIQSQGHSPTARQVLIEVLYCLPLLYLVLFIVYWVVDRKTGCTQKAKKYEFLHSFFQVREEHERVNFDDTIPHRLVNPREYQQL